MTLEEILEVLYCGYSNHYKQLSFDKDTYINNWKVLIDGKIENISSIVHWLKKYNVYSSEMDEFFFPFTFGIEK